MRVSVQALTEVSVSAFDRAEVTERLADHPLLSRAVLETCVTNAGLWERVMTVLGQGSAEERAASLLLHLTKELSRRNIIREHSYPFPLRLPHIRGRDRPHADSRQSHCRPLPQAEYRRYVRREIERLFIPPSLSASVRLTERFYEFSAAPSAGRAFDRAA